MEDVRQRVEEDRGLLKKIQLHIPGFAGYRQREDARAADSILRLQMADGLVKVRQELEESRRMMMEEFMTEHIDRLGSAINKLRTLEGKVRHAEQGYSGFSAAIRIQMAELNRLYEYDLAMITSIQELAGAAQRLRGVTSGGDKDNIKTELNAIRDQLTAFQRAFEDRMPIVSGIFNI